MKTPASIFYPVTYPEFQENYFRKSVFQLYFHFLMQVYYIDYLQR